MMAYQRGLTKELIRGTGVSCRVLICDAIRQEFHRSELGEDAARHFLYFSKPEVCKAITITHGYRKTILQRQWIASVK
jgi:hypothetical protein